MFQQFEEKCHWEKIKATFDRKQLLNRIERRLTGLSTKWGSTKPKCCRPKHDVDQIGVGQNSGVDQIGNFETIATGIDQR